MVVDQVPLLAPRSARSVMISRSRSAPSAAAMSIECTTSANNTVTCLYSAGFGAEVTAAPHSLQNLADALSSVPHDPHNSAAAVISPGHPAVVHINIVSWLASRWRAHSPAHQALHKQAARTTGRSAGAPADRPPTETLPASRCRSTDPPARLEVYDGVQTCVWIVSWKVLRQFIWLRPRIKSGI